MEGTHPHAPGYVHRKVGWRFFFWRRYLHPAERSHRQLHRWVCYGQWQTDRHLHHRWYRPYRGLWQGIPLGRWWIVFKINTGGKYDSKAFKKSVGLNGVGTKAVNNALSSHFKVAAFREGQARPQNFPKVIYCMSPKSWKVTRPMVPWLSSLRMIAFSNIFRHEYIENQIWNYAYLNAAWRSI